MNINPLKNGIIMQGSKGVGTVSHDMVFSRAVEIAIVNGRSAQSVSKSDWQQARRELTGQSDVDPQTDALEAATEAERWDVIPGSNGTKIPVAPSEDEDEEGRSDKERLVEEGVAEAALDQMVKATKTVL